MKYYSNINVHVIYTTKCEIKIISTFLISTYFIIRIIVKLQKIYEENFYVYFCTVVLQ